tara:strand:- start:478 stop:855 length:378 start_codon:yes stop_codon:yes gene_type:complete
MVEIIIALCVFLFLSVAINGVLVWYAKTNLSKVDTIYTASESASEIFSMIESYRSHLSSVYEKPLFYGDETLQGLLEHTNSLIKFLKRYEEVYSFTQPNLEEKLLTVSGLPEEHDEENKEEAEEQ